MTVIDILKASQASLNQTASGKVLQTTAPIGSFNNQTVVNDSVTYVDPAQNQFSPTTIPGFSPTGEDKGETSADFAEIRLKDISIDIDTNRITPTMLSDAVEPHRQGVATLIYVIKESSDKRPKTAAITSAFYKNAYYAAFTVEPLTGQGSPLVLYHCTVVNSDIKQVENTSAMPISGGSSSSFILNVRIDLHFVDFTVDNDNDRQLSSNSANGWEF